MKTIAYLCSYELNSEISAQQLAKQRAEINNFCKVHGIKLDEIYTEIASKDDYKPVLLNIMSNSFNTTQRIIISNTDVISRDKNFKDWVCDEFNRMHVEIAYVSMQDNKQDNFQKKNLPTITENIKNIPSLPEIITKSIEIMQDENTSAETLARLISNDIGLTARVLKLVNSAYYGFPKQISTIKQAITILGFTTIKGLIISASVFKMFSYNSNNSSFNYKRFWKHSIITASTARQLAQYVEIKKIEDIFSAAFLHNIGKIILAHYDKENYAKINKHNPKNEIEQMKYEEEYCGLNHCEIGNIIAYSWNLPEIFCEIITNHHSYKNSLNYSVECAVVSLASEIANSIENNTEFNIDNITLDILEKINISSQNIYCIYKNLKDNATSFNDIEKILSR